MLLSIGQYVYAYKFEFKRCCMLGDPNTDTRTSNKCNGYNKMVQSLLNIYYNKLSIQVLIFLILLRPYEEFSFI